MVILNAFKKYYVEQVDENDCGVAALAMILKKYGSDVTLAHLRRSARTTLKGTTAYGIVETAQKFNFSTKAVQADETLFEMDDIIYPFIAHVVKKGGLNHYYVVVDANEEYVKIADPDPSVKITKMSKADFMREWTGVTLFIFPQSTYVPVKDEKRGLRTIFLSLFTKKSLIVNIVLAATLMMIIGICGSYFFQVIIDRIIPNSMTTTLNLLAIGLIIAYLFNSIFSYARDFLLAILGQKLSIEIILGYIKHIFELPLDFFATRKIGDIMARFSDGNKVIDALASSVVSIFLDVTTVIILGMTLCIQNRVLFLISILVLPVYVIVILFFSKKFEELNRKEMESGAVVSSSIIEDIRGIETIKSLNGERMRYQRIDSQYVDLLKKMLAYTKADVLQQAIKIFIRSLLEVFILLVGANFVIKGKLSVGQLMTYNALLSYFITPLQNIINLQPKIQSARIANTRLNEIFYVDSEFKESRPVKEGVDIQGPIEVANVTYGYEYGKDILKNVSLSIKPNDKVTIVGMSGSGKSTLAKLLVNFYNPNKGKITFNGNNVTMIDKHILRENIVYVPQTPYIFAGSVRENLTLGRSEHLTLAQIKQACQIAEIDKEIEELSLQYETVLDENGGSLSGGQQQRLAIARALLSPAKVLIFDESTSNLDPILERKIIDNLLRLSDRTIIFIAHRLIIAEKTNNIIVMKSGKIVERGRHAELIKQGKYYAELAGK